MSKLPREEFKAINGRLLEAKKAVRERDRILSLMASLDESLAREQQTLAELTEQLEAAKARVEELEGVTVTAVWQRIMGNHEAELTEEAEKYAALKMAHEASEIKIQSVTDSLREFEAALVDMADCDEALAAVQAEQQAFMVANGRLPAEKIQQLNHIISEGQTFLREAHEALTIGVKASQALEALFQRVEMAKKHILRNPRGFEIVPSRDEHWFTYSGIGAIVSAASEIQPTLDLFQMELGDIGARMAPHPDLEIPAYLEVMPNYKSRFGNNEPRRIRRIQVWKKHLESLYEYLRQKTDYLEEMCLQAETAVTRAQTDLQTLIDQHWQQGATTNE